MCLTDHRYHQLLDDMKRGWEPYQQSGDDRKHEEMKQELQSVQGWSEAAWWGGGRAGGRVLPCPSSTWESLSPPPALTARRSDDAFLIFPAATSAGVKQLIGSFVHDESIRIYNIHRCLFIKSDCCFLRTTAQMFEHTHELFLAERR